MSSTGCGIWPVMHLSHFISWRSWKCYRKQKILILVLPVHVDVNRSAEVLNEIILLSLLQLLCVIPTSFSCCVLGSRYRALSDLVQSHRELSKSIFGQALLQLFCTRMPVIMHMHVHILDYRFLQCPLFVYGLFTSTYLAMLRV